MIYVDTSVILAHVLAESAQPPAHFWTAQHLVTSRLTEFESWVRIQAYGKGPTHGAVLAATLATLDVVEVDDETCARCRAPLPVPMRTLDAMHLATADFLRMRGIDVVIATYDHRMAAGARALGFVVADATTLAM